MKKNGGQRQIRVLMETIGITPTFLKGWVTDNKIEQFND